MVRPRCRSANQTQLFHANAGRENRRRAVLRKRSLGLPGDPPTACNRQTSPRAAPGWGRLAARSPRWACPHNFYRPLATPGLARLLGGSRVRPKTQTIAQRASRPLPPITCSGRPSEPTHGAKAGATDPRGSPLRGMLCAGCGVARVRVPDAGRTKPAAKSLEWELPGAVGRGESEPFRARPGSPRGTWTTMWRALGCHRDGSQFCPRRRAS